MEGPVPEEESTRAAERRYLPLAVVGLVVVLGLVGAGIWLVSLADSIEPSLGASPSSALAQGDEVELAGTAFEAGAEVALAAQPPGDPAAAQPWTTATADDDGAFRVAATLDLTGPLACPEGSESTEIEVVATVAGTEEATTSLLCG